MRPPRYYDKKFDETHPHWMEYIRNNRIEKMLHNLENNTLSVWLIAAVFRKVSISIFLVESLTRYYDCVIIKSEMR